MDNNSVKFHHLKFKGYYEPHCVPNMLARAKYISRQNDALQTDTWKRTVSPSECHSIIFISKHKQHHFLKTSFFVNKIIIIFYSFGNKPPLKKNVELSSSVTPQNNFKHKKCLDEVKVKRTRVECRWIEVLLC